MSLLEPCSSCARHVRADAARCPFCGGAPAPRLDVRPRFRAARRLSRAAIAAGAVMLGSACGDEVVYDDEVVADETSGGESTGEGGGGFYVDVDPGPYGHGPLETQEGPAGDERELEARRRAEEDEARQRRELEARRRAEEDEAQRQRQHEALRQRELQRRMEEEERRFSRPRCVNGNCPPYGAPALPEALV